MNIYSHAQLHDLAAAADSLPIVPPTRKATDIEELRATGTDGKPTLAPKTRGPTAYLWAYP